MEQQEAARNCGIIGRMIADEQSCTSRAASSLVAAEGKAEEEAKHKNASDISCVLKTHRTLTLSFFFLPFFLHTLLIMLQTVIPFLIPTFCAAVISTLIATKCTFYTLGFAHQIIIITIDRR